MYSPALTSTLNLIAYKYRDQIEKTLKEVFAQSRYRNTGAGADSVMVEVVEGSPTQSPDIVIRVADHMTILDRRNLQWTSMPPVDALEQWGQTKTFQTVPGYKNGQAPNLPPWKAKLRVLWAIAKSKQKFDTHKPKPWRKKSLGSVLKEMNRTILIEFDKAIEDELQAAANKGSQWLN